jgi:hypothetical protein
MPIAIKTKEKMLADKGKNKKGMAAKRKSTASGKMKTTPMVTTKPKGRQDYQGAPMQMDAEYKSAGGMVYKGR